MSFFLVIKHYCLVGGGASYPCRCRLRPLPEMKDLLSLRGSLGPWEEAQILFLRTPPYLVPAGIGSSQGLVHKWKVVLGSSPQDKKSYASKRLL